MNETPAEPRKKKGSSKIEWTDDTDNAAAGCEEARLPDGSMSPECTHCYARLQSARLELMGMGLYNGVAVRNGGGEGNTARWTGVFRWDLELLKKRFREMKAGHKIFFGSMTDLWHPSHDPALLAALAVELRKLGERPKKRLPQAVITLTKHAERLLDWQQEHFPEGLPAYHWPGVTAGVQASANHRIATLLEVEAHGPLVVSMEPLLGSVDLTNIRTKIDDLGRDDTLIQNALTGDFRWEYAHEEAGNSGKRIGWVIVGGESGQKARPMHPEWARSLRDQCNKAGVPFHFKQFGEWIPRSHTEKRHDWHAERTPDAGGWRVSVPQKCRWVALAHDGSLSEATVWNGHDDDGPGSESYMHRVGKAKAGRLLDGREWNEYPETSGDQDAP